MYDLLNVFYQGLFMRRSTLFSTRLALSFLPQQTSAPLVPTDAHAPLLAERIIESKENSQGIFFFNQKLILRLKQITPISRNFSDHCGYLIDMGCGELLSLNWLKKILSNDNGFGKKNETLAEYHARLIYIANIVCNIIKERNVVILMAQEFAINDKDIEIILNEIKKAKIPGWENPEMHITPFGLMTCFKSGAIRNAFYFNEDLAEKLGEYAIRCQVFDAGDVYTLANTHTPFKMTEAVFKKITRLLIESKIIDSDNRLKMIDFIGDKNLSPEIQAQLIEEVFNEIRAERIVAGKKPITFISYLVSSPDGHQKMVDEKPVRVNVDSIQRFVIYESPEYAFHHISDNAPEGKYRRLLALLFGTTTVVACKSVGEMVLAM